MSYRFQTPALEPCHSPVIRLVQLVRFMDDVLTHGTKIVS